MQVGDIIDEKYELVRPLGEGGMGQVWEGRHRRIGRRVALKFLHKELAQSSEIVERFLREAQAAAAIGSENIIDVTDVGETGDGVPYLVMEYLDGEDLASRLRSRGPFEPAEAVRVLIPAIRAVAAAHGQGIIHRDLKPDNVFLTPREDGSERVKVLDFGIAKYRDSVSEKAPNLTATGMILGTPFYMSPEQARGAKDLGEQADVYSLGVILYELLAGKPPFDAQSYNEIIVLIATSEPVPLRMVRPDVPEALEGIVQRAMAKDTGGRFASARDLLDVLEAFLRDPAGTIPWGAVEGSGAQPLAPSPTAAPGAAPSMGASVAEAEPVELPGGRGRGAILAIAAAVVVLGGIAAAFALSGGADPAEGPVGGGAVAEQPVVGSAPDVVGAPEAGAPAESARVDAAAAGERPGTVELRVSVEPAEARIFVDGIAVSGNPFVGRFRRDGAQHPVKASLEGHRDEALFVSFDEDRQVELVLEELRRAPSRPGKRPGGQSGPAPTKGRVIDRTNPYGGD